MIVVPRARKGILEMRNAVREQGAGEGAEQPARTGEAVPGQDGLKQGGGEAIAHVVLAVAGTARSTVTTSTR